MPVLVDTNVILDIASDDTLWADWSEEQLHLHQPGGLVVNPIIYSELCTRAGDISEVDRILFELKLEFTELPRSALFAASKAFLQYRKQGGTRNAPLPDFYIGAHAQSLGMPIITRDKGRYQTYFPTVRLIHPG